MIRLHRAAAQSAGRARYRPASSADTGTFADLFGRPPLWLANGRLLLWLSWTALIAGLLFAFYRGARAPSAWATMYNLPTYEDGPLRRSLVGTFLDAVGLNTSYEGIVVFSWSAMAAVVLLLLAIAIRLRDPLFNLFVALALAGPFGTYFFHLIGYPDVLLILALIGVSCLSAWPVAQIAIGALSLYVHEIALMVVVPTIVLMIFQNRGLRAAVTAGLLLLLAFAPLLLFDETEAADLARFQARAVAVLGDSLRHDFFEALELGLADRFRFWEPLNFGWCLVWMSPLFLAAVWCELQHARFDALLLAGAGAAPLLLSLFGWDIDRWFFLSGVVLLVGCARRIAWGPVPPQTSMLLVAALIWTSQFDFWMFDGERPRLLRYSTVESFSREVVGGSLGSLVPDHRTAAD